MTGTEKIAIVGMACRYPDAASPAELWDNAVAGRRAFRKLPDVRMNLEDYYDPDPSRPDRFYAQTAAVIEGYEFDRVGYKIAGSTYRSTDLTHWLALDMAGRALADAGFPAAEGLPRERTGVIVGNTLTGEFTRANLMRLRWPYVRRTLAAALREQGWDDDRLAAFLTAYEEQYKSPFPPVDEDTLAGGLANTIAGRICNYFDLNGGGYTVDGACSSSLLAVTTACQHLQSGALDAAVAGGVDLSIDPFEIIGFAKTGALARSEMKVYDRGSNGFWPGEGCGMLVLMRLEDAMAAGHRVYASVAGWGVSSDGKGGITRPEVSGYRLALDRAYERAGFGIETVELFEGHGTGTPVGDKTELTALSQARAEADPAAEPAVVSTIKAMIGHTKAAAGVAGLIKAAMAVNRQTLPPALGCADPHELLTGDEARLRVLRKAEPWPAGRPVRAGITAMGFGGINTHVVLEAAGGARRPFGARAKSLASSLQDAELLLIDARTPEHLLERLTELADYVPALSYAQLADLADTLQSELRDQPYRAAVVASSPVEATRRLTKLRDAVAEGRTDLFSPGAFLGHSTRPARIGLLFPGQGSGRGTGGGALRRRFPEAEEIFLAAGLPDDGDTVATAVAQPRIVTGSMAGLRALALLGVEARVAVGHSLGELSALHWAGVMDEPALLSAAARRGQAMTEHSTAGTMAGIAASADQVTALIGDFPVVIAGYNGPKQTVVAGPVDAVQALGRAAETAGLHWTRLPVSHAFHSPLVAPASEVFGGWLDGREFAAPRGRVISTVTGTALTSDTDVRELLRRQITEPVRFIRAVETAAEQTDLFIEVGPGRVLTGLAGAITDVPVVALDTDDESLTSLLRVAGAAFTAGASLAHEALFDGRLIRPLVVGAPFSFLESPCEQAPDVRVRENVSAATAAGAAEATAASDDGAPEDEATIELIRRMAADRAELPPELVTDDSKLLDDLHLSSITVGQIMNHAAQRKYGTPAEPGLMNYASATVRELSEALDIMGDGSGPSRGPAARVTGAAPWTRAFAVELEERPLPPATAAEDDGPWKVFGGGTPFADELRRALERARVGSGVLVCLPGDGDTAVLAQALAGAKDALAGPAGTRFVVVQHGSGAAGLAKTLRLEAPRVRVTIVHAPERSAAVGWAMAEIAATSGFSEAYYDPDGVRRTPVLWALPVRPTREEAALGESDVLLVTGGGKGITAECALAMALDSGARLALLGRSDPASDPELAATLRRMADLGITAHYARADVTDAGQVRAAVAEVSAALGPVTAVLHGAGRNEPAGITALEPADFQRTFAPKIDGLKAVLEAVGPGGLRLLVTFGSIIGRAGLPGEAHYATANEWLADLTRATGEEHPGCRVLCVEWSVWSGVGMGEKLSVLEGLEHGGVVPITPEQGVETLRRLVADPDVPAVVVVSGRTGATDTARYEEPPLPLLRFVGTPLVRYHDVELVTEIELNAGTDHYLGDHRLDGNLLFPAVFGMEAMAQAAIAVTGGASLPTVEDAQFVRPIVVPPDGSAVLRIAATVIDDGAVEVVIQAAETGFAADHFRATLRFGSGEIPAGPPLQAPDGLPPVRLDPAADMYGSVLFQGERFHRLRRYHRAAAKHVDAEVTARDTVDWFSGFLPAELLLGDPGLRDALMHGNQVCVPDATLLPIGIDRVQPGGDKLTAAGSLRYCATEREHDGDSYVYDIAVRTAAGEVLERWEGLRLQAVRKTGTQGPWVVPLLGAHLERSLEDLLGAAVSVAVEPHDPGAPGQAGPLAIRRAQAGPEAAGPFTASADGPGVSLGVAAASPVACRVLSVPAAPAVPGAEDLTGRVRDALGESASATGARITAALACLDGVDPAGLDLVPADRDGWAVFAAGDRTVATFVTTLRDVPDPVVFAIATEGRS